MAKRKRRPPSEDAASPARQRTTRVAKQPTEGRVAEKKDQEALKRYWNGVQARGDPTRRYKEFMRQRVRLKLNGAEMELGNAEFVLAWLRELQDEKPKQFAALVAIVKPKHGTRRPEKVSPKTIASLKKLGILAQDGSPDERFAAVLDAAYQEMEHGIILRDPIIYPSREFVEERKALEDQRTAWAAWAMTGRRPENRRKTRGDDAPSR